MPLVELTGATLKSQWGDTEERSFLALRLDLVKFPVLGLPDFNRLFLVTTDASDAAAGAISEQQLCNELQPISFASLKLHQGEARYSAYERESLGIVWANGKSKQYSQGSETTLFRLIARLYVVYKPYIRKE